MYVLKITFCFSATCGHLFGAAPHSSEPLAPARMEAGSHVNSRAMAKEILDKPAEEVDIDRFAENVRIQFAQAMVAGPRNARAVVAEATEIVDRLNPASEGARKRLDALKETITFYKRLLDAGVAEFEALTKRLQEAPNDHENFLLFEIKFQLEDDARYEKETLAQALARLGNVVAVLKMAKAKTADKRIADECTILIERIAEFHKPRLQKAQARLALIGTHAVWPSADRTDWVNGKPIGVEKFLGSVVLLDFWELSCEPCITGFAKVEQWRKRYESQGLVVVSVARRDNNSNLDGQTQVERIASLFRELNLGFSCAIDEGGLFEGYRVEGVPHYVLVDRAGIIRMIRTGNQMNSLSDMNAEIERLLKDVRKVRN